MWRQDFQNSELGCDVICNFPHLFDLPSIERLNRIKTFMRARLSFFLSTALNSKTSNIKYPTQKQFGVYTDLETMQKGTRYPILVSSLQLQRSNFPDVSSRLLCVMSPIVNSNLDDLPGNQCMTGEENQWGATHMVRHLGFGQSSCALRS